MCIYKIYCEGLVHTILKAGKSHDLPSTSWRPKKAVGVVQSKSEGLGISRASGLSVSLRVENYQFPSTVTQKKRRIPPSSAFCPIPTLEGVDEALRQWEGQSAVLNLLIQM